MAVTELFSPLQAALANVQAALAAGDLAEAQQQATRAQFGADGLSLLVGDPPDRYAQVNLPGEGLESGFVFKHAEPHPFAGYMGRYPKEDGDTRKLLGYPTSYVLWFASRAPLLQYVRWADGQLHPANLFADNGRLCVKELAGALALGEIPVIAIPFDPDQERWPDLPDNKPDPRNKGPFSLRELAQGPNGPAALYFEQLGAFIRRLVAGGITKAWFRLAWEMTGKWYRDHAANGDGGWWLLAFNAIGAFIRSLMAGAQMIWNMAREVSAGMAPMGDTLWLTALDAAAINASGLVPQVVAGKPIEANALGIDPYNACWLTTSRVSNTMTPDQVQRTRASRWKNEGGRYLDALEAAADKLAVPLCLPEWGTGYDFTGVPVDAQGQPLPYNGKVGGDDPWYVEQIYNRLLRWRRTDRLVFAAYWERKASDGDTMLGASDCVVHRTGKPRAWTSAKADPAQKPLAAQKFVECFGLPFCG